MLSTDMKEDISFLKNSKNKSEIGWRNACIHYLPYVEELQKQSQLKKTKKTSSIQSRQRRKLIKELLEEIKAFQQITIGMTGFEDPGYNKLIKKILMVIRTYR
jgi:deoxyribodipyrimidine photolyase